MMDASWSSQKLIADVNSLGQLKLKAGKNDPEALKETARQFESLFMHELLKSMRQATMRSGLLDSQEENMATDLLDQQFSRSMAGQSGGLSNLLIEQLTRQAGTIGSSPAANPASSIGAANPTTGSVVSTSSTAPASHQAGATVTDFVKQHARSAQAASERSGIPSSFMLGQAGHETGWGRHQILRNDGSPSHNLFGIKAGAGWTGPVAEVTTTEYIGGQPHKVSARFRAYDSYQESFADYARLIQGAPRYAQARQNLDSAQEFASSLQQSGYATDPRYGAKLTSAIERVAQVQANKG